MENLSMVFFKKKNMKRLSFITQFKIEFLLLFTGCRKMHGKMPGKYKKLPGDKLLMKKRIFGKTFCRVKFF